MGNRTYALLYLFGDRPQVPYIVIDPPDNFGELLAEWSKLDYRDYPDDWLRKKGINIFKPDRTFQL